MTTLPPIFLFALQKVLYGAIHALFEFLQCDHQVEPECYPLMIKCMCLSLLLKIIRQKCIRLACNNLTFFIPYIPFSIAILENIPYSVIINSMSLHSSTIFSIDFSKSNSFVAASLEIQEIRI